MEGARVNLAREIVLVKVPGDLSSRTRVNNGRGEGEMEFVIVRFECVSEEHVSIHCLLILYI